MQCVLQINILQSRRRIDVLDTVSDFCSLLFSASSDSTFKIIPLSINAVLLMFQILKFMHAQSTYFHQGYDLMNDLDEYMKKVSKEVKIIHLIMIKCTKHYKAFIKIL